MIKISLLFIVLTSSIFAKDALKNISENAFGIGYPGFIYRMYNNENQSYIEAVGYLFASKREREDIQYRSSLGINYGKYVFSTKDIQLKYRFGLAFGYRNDDYIFTRNDKRHDHNGYKVESNVGIGVEVNNFLDIGVNLDLFFGEELIYYETTGLVLNPTVNCSLIFKY
jgi:hypothetical protein